MTHIPEPELTSIKILAKIVAQAIVDNSKKIKDTDGKEMTEAKKFVLQQNKIL